MNGRSLGLHRASSSDRSVRRADVLTRTIQREVVVLDRAAGYVHQLNETASCVWNRCDGAHSADDIAAHLAVTYDVPLAEVLSDVSATLADFRRLGLVVDSLGSE